MTENSAISAFGLTSARLPTLFADVSTVVRACEEPQKVASWA
jgi:hypothetical protein